MQQVCNKKSKSAFYLKNKPLYQEKAGNLLFIKDVIFQIDFSLY